ncbi:MAG: hypothetical protein R3B06_03440 [Kofleriaceae bacterium]
MRRVVIAAFVVGAACGRSSNSERREPPATTTTATPPATTTTAPTPGVAAPVGPRARAVIEQVEHLDDDALEWTAGARDPGASDATVPPPPPGAVAAVAALVAWADAGEAFALPCFARETSVLMRGFSLWLAAVRTAPTVDAPAVAAVLRYAQALRAPSNSDLAIVVGATLAVATVGVWTKERHQPLPPALAALLPTEAVVADAGRAALRCGAALAQTVTLDGQPAAVPAGPVGADRLPDQTAAVLAARRDLGLSTAPGWIETERTDYTAFWRETAALAEQATTPADVLALYEARRALAARHPTSMMVRLVGDMLFNDGMAARLTQLGQDIAADRP